MLYELPSVVVYTAELLGGVSGLVGGSVVQYSVARVANVADNTVKRHSLVQETMPPSPDPVPTRSLCQSCGRILNAGKGKEAFCRKRARVKE